MAGFGPWKLCSNGQANAKTYAGHDTTVGFSTKPYGEKALETARVRFHSPNLASIGDRIRKTDLFQQFHRARSVDNFQSCAVGHEKGAGEAERIYRYVGIAFQTSGDQQHEPTSHQQVIGAGLR